MSSEGGDPWQLELHGHVHFLLCICYFLHTPDLFHRGSSVPSWVVGCQKREAQASGNQSGPRPCFSSDGPVPRLQEFVSSGGFSSLHPAESAKSRDTVTLLRKRVSSPLSRPAVQAATVGSSSCRQNCSPLVRNFPKNFVLICLPSWVSFSNSCLLCFTCHLFLPFILFIYSLFHGNKLIVFWGVAGVAHQENEGS